MPKRSPATSSARSSTKTTYWPNPYLCNQEWHGRHKDRVWVWRSMTIKSNATAFASRFLSHSHLCPSAFICGSTSALLHPLDAQYLRPLPARAAASLGEFGPVILPVARYASEEA